MTSLAPNHVPENFVGSTNHVDMLRLLPSSSTSAKDTNFLAAVFFALLDSMTIRQKTVGIEASAIANNAKLQNKLNKEDAELRFENLPPNAKTATIQQVQIYNQEVSALRAVVANMILTARQNGQMSMTEASTNVDILQQNTSADSRVLRIMYTVFQSIIKMSGLQ